MMLLKGEKCPNCEKNLLFPSKAVPNSLNLIFKCQGCGYETELQPCKEPPTSNQNTSREE